MYDLDSSYTVVSTEMMNPFAKAGSFVLNKFKEFINYWKKDTDIDINKLNNTVCNHPQLLNSAEFDKKFAERKFVYSDISPVTVFCPSNLKQGKTMLDYAKYLEEVLPILDNILNETLPESISVLGIYITNPQKLKDIVPVTLPKQTIAATDNLIVKSKKHYGEVTNKSANKTERSFSELYRRVEDFRQVKVIAGEIYSCSEKHRELLPRLNKKMVELTTQTDRLMQLINTDEKYSMNSVNGSYITHMLYSVAEQIEFAGAATHNILTFLNAINDTIIKLNNLK